MRNWLGFACAIALALLVGCGGGGGGGGGGSTNNITIRGVVLWLKTGGPPAPAATVQAGSNSSLTSDVDGSFSVLAPVGTTSLAVIYQPTGGSAVTFRYDFPAASVDVELGDLIIGPQKVTVTGQVKASSDSSPISGATVRFAGLQTTTGSDGKYVLDGVAYDPSADFAFSGLEGRVSATGYFATSFFATSTPLGSTVDIDPIFLSTDDGSTPPGTPYNIFGTISPANLAPGTVVELWLGSTKIRQMTVSGQDYGFWVGIGNYTLKFTNPTNSKTSPDQLVDIATSSQVARKDATLQ